MSLKLVYQKLVDLPDDSDPIEVRLECDSNLVVGRLNGAAACKKKRLIPLFERAMDELFDIRASTLVSHIEVVHISRDFNGLTDQLAKNAAARHCEPVYSGVRAHEHECGQ